METVHMNHIEFLEKFGELVLEFREYYKFAFTYHGYTKEGGKIVVNVGGADVYTIRVGAAMTVNRLFEQGVLNASVEAETQFFEYETY